MESSSESTPLPRLSKSKITYSKSNFTLHSFQDEINDEIVLFQVIKMRDSVFVWIGYRNKPVFDSLSLSVNNRYDNVPIATAILGEMIESNSKNIARKLSKRLRKAVYISFNLEDDKFILPGVEKRLQEEIKKYPDRF